MPVYNILNSPHFLTETLRVQQIHPTPGQLSAEISVRAARPAHALLACTTGPIKNRLEQVNPLSICEGETYHRLMLALKLRDDAVFKSY